MSDWFSGSAITPQFPCFCLAGTAARKNAKKGKKKSSKGLKKSPKLKKQPLEEAADPEKAADLTAASKEARLRRTTAALAQGTGEKTVHECLQGRCVGLRQAEPRGSWRRCWPNRQGGA